MEQQTNPTNPINSSRQVNPQNTETHISTQNSITQPLPKKSPSKKPLIILSSLLAIILCGLAIWFIFKLFSQEPAPASQQSQKPTVSQPKKFYDRLTGEQVPDDSKYKAPTFCVQIPNDNYGARPQAGIKEAKIVFEAIAEAGITRFAAIYQDPKSSAIGPIRSLRLYYFNWDGPFNCTIVHDGGADDAIHALRISKESDLNALHQYTWKTNEGRRWDNLFSSGQLMQAFKKDRKHQQKEPKGFARMTPEDAKKDLENYINKIKESQQTQSQSENQNQPNSDKKQQPSTQKVSFVKNIRFKFGGIPIFNPVYTYDEKDNHYLRSYQDKSKHLSYECPPNLKNPSTKSACGQPQIVTPKVVIAIMVKQKRAADNYHEDIDTIGSGDAYIFQNGQALKANWIKRDRKSQIEFLNQDGQEIKLIPGQTFISAIPIGIGGVEF